MMGFTITPQELDYIFPLVAACSGAAMLFLFSSEWVHRGLERHLGYDMAEVKVRVNRRLGWIFFVVGTLWSVQNLFL